MRKKGIFVKIILAAAGIIFAFIAVVFINLLIVERVQSIVTEGQPIENYGEPGCALLVIDIQEATTGEVSGYQYFRENSDDLITKINETAERFSKACYPVVYIRSEISNPLVNLLNNSYSKNHPGSKHDKRLKIVSGFEVVKKGKDSFRNTNLDSILTVNRVNELYMVGLDAAECVNATAEAARNRGYSVSLIKDGVISKSREMTDSMMVVFMKNNIKVIMLDSLTLDK